MRGKESAFLQCRRSGFDPWVGKIPWRGTWQPTPVFLPEQSHGQRSLAGYSPWGHKESHKTERLTPTPTHTHTHTHTMAMYVRNSGADCVVLAQGFYDFAISTVAGESASMMIDSHGAGCLQGSSVPPCLGFSMVCLSEKVPDCPD